MKHFILAAAIAAVATALNAADAVKPAAPAVKKSLTYATDAKPVIDATCIKCHNAEKAKAGLQMDSLEGILKAEKKGKLVEPGKSADSRLVKIVESIAAAANDPEGKTRSQHKPGVKPLTAEQISLLRDWIDQGAK